MSTYDIGDKIRLSVALTDVAGTPADPTLVTCTVRKPDNSTSALQVANTGVGLNYADVTLDQEGSWYYRWAGTGALVVAQEGTFFVDRQRV